jgi:hypothetical protein
MDCKLPVLQHECMTSQQQTTVYIRLLEKIKELTSSILHYIPLYYWCLDTQFTIHLERER